MSTETVRVLLVEDDPDDVLLVRTALREDRSASFIVTVASEVGHALTHLDEGPFDIVLLDLSLPDAQGPESVATILHGATGTPVIVLTGLDDEELAVHAMQLGAQDYLVKGRVSGDLLVRSIRYARERHHLLAERTRRLEREFELAGLVQRTFLPASSPTRPGYSIGGHLHASGQIGGDFFDFVDLDDGQLAVAVGDASGKGIPGAILMAKAQAILKAELARSIEPIDVVRTLNRTLCDGKTLDRFVTLFYGVLHPDEARLSYVSAGHPRALQFGTAQDALASTGPPLGLFLDAHYEQRAVSLAQNDRLVVYSDGVSEAQNGEGRFFDEEGICTVVTEHPGDSADDLARAICESAQRFERARPDPGDDKTVVVVQRSAR